MLRAFTLVVDGTAWCWGFHSPFPPELSFAQIDCGYEHVCGLSTEGEIACWGLCVEGQCDVPD